MKWQDIIGWIVAALLLLIVMAAGGGYIFLKSAKFQQIAIHRITQAADQATGGKTEIRALGFSLRTLKVHLFDIKVHGTEESGQQPLLQIDNLTVDIKIQSLRQRKFHLDELLIAHPVACVRVNRAGTNNIPKSPAVPVGNPSVNIFQLAVGHFQIVNGEINYNDKKTPVDADLHELDLNTHFDSGASSYVGSISYNNGHVRYAQYAPMPHALRANFKATAAELSFEPADVSIGSSTANLRASIANYSKPSLSGDYKIHLHTQDFAAMAQGANPAGDISLVGNFQIPNINAPSLVRISSTDGVFLSDAFSAVASGGRIEARKLHGNYHLANGSLRATGIGLESLGGIIQAEVGVQRLDATPSTQVRANFRNISLQAAQRLLNRPELKQIALSGLVDGSSDFSWTGSVKNIRATSDLSLRASAGQSAGQSAAGQSAGQSKAASDTAQRLPVDGVIHVAYDGPRNVITLHDTLLNIPSTRVTAQGELSDRSNLRFHATTSDLHKLLTLAYAFRADTAPPAIEGSASLNATVHGSMSKPQVSGELAAQNLKVQGSEWRSVQANLAATPDHLVISDGSLISAQRGQASFNASVGLQNWAYLPSNPVKADLSVQQVSIADLQHLVNSHYPITGDISATFSLTGSQLSPEGSGTLRILHGQAYDEPLQNFAIKFSADHDALQSSLDVAIAAGSATANLSFAPKTKEYKVKFDVSSLSLQRLRYVHDRNLLLYGYLTASANGSGTLDNPELTATVQLPKLTLRDKSIFGVKAQLRVANKQADFDLNSLVLDSSVQAHGRVNLDGGYYTDASLDTAALPLDLLLALYLPNLPEGVKGQTEFHARLAGPLKDPSQIRASLTIPTLRASYQALQIGTTGPIRADYANSVITLEPAEIDGGNNTSLRFHGTIPLSGNSAHSFVAQGSMDLHILQMLSSDIRSSGSITLDVNTSGAAQHPNVNGQVVLNNVSVIQAGAPLGIEKLNGTLNIDNERIQLTSLSGQVGGGKLSAGGSITYKPVQFNVALDAQSVRLRYPNGLRAVLDGNLALTGTRDSSVLSGRILVDSLSFTPDFDLATFADQFSGSTATPVQPGFAESINLAIAVQSKENLSATSSQVSLEGSANLRVSGTVAVPIITGRSDLTAGELFYRNVRYQLQRGIITFDDPYQTHPVLNVSVLTNVKQYNLTLNLRGPFEKLTTSYSADPPLATADIINLLATGKTTQEAAASQSTDSMIASQAASQVSGSVQKLAGLSSLQIDPLIGGNNQNPSARIAIQQRVTRNFLFTFSTDVSQPGSEVVQGYYRINKRWSVSAARQEAGGVSVQGRFHTSF
jgi:translocation and assembly module TamB